MLNTQLSNTLNTMTTLRTNTYAALVRAVAGPSALAVLDLADSKFADDLNECDYPNAQFWYKADWTGLSTQIKAAELVRVTVDLIFQRIFADRLISAQNRVSGLVKKYVQNIIELFLLNLLSPTCNSCLDDECMLRSCIINERIYCVLSSG